MKEHLLKLISELTGKISPPMWTIFVKTFFAEIKSGNTYEGAKEIAQKEVDKTAIYLGNDPYVPESKFDYSMTGDAVLPNFGILPFFNAKLLARHTSKAEKRFSENEQVQRARVVEFKAVQASLNQAQKDIALRWDDGKLTPPAHLLMIVMENSSNEDDYEMAIKVMHQAAIACWAIKYEVRQGRPEEMILQFFGDVFIPLIATPRHPSTPSGHSTFSAAIAELFKHWKDVKDPITGIVYKDFAELQNEASMSRLYGGIHFMIDCILGTELGRDIAAQYTKFKQFFYSKAA